jgi:hypothetical protein
MYSKQNRATSVYHTCAGIFRFIRMQRAVTDVLVRRRRRLQAKAK